MSQPDFLVRLPEIRAITGLSRSSVYRRIRHPLAGQPPFPAPVKLGRVAAWSRAEVADWIDALKTARPAA